MIRNDFSTPEVQGAYQLHDIGDFELEEGGRIPGLQLAYATYGELNAAKDNAILMFFPPRDCAAEQALVPGAELRVLPSVAGHFGLFGFEPSYLAEVDRNLSELLAIPVP